MKKMVLIAFGILLVTSFAFGQKSFKKTYGGDNYDRGISVQQTSDKGYAIVGYTRSFGAGKNDDNKGSHLWTRGFSEQVFKPITTTRGYNGGLSGDGGYIFAGDVFVYRSETKSLVYFVKVDKNGN